MSLYNALMTGTTVCSHCFAAVHLENAERHAAWHAHLNRLIDIASGTKT